MLAKEMLLQTQTECTGDTIFKKILSA